MHYEIALIRKSSRSEKGKKKNSSLNHLNVIESTAQE